MNIQVKNLGEVDPDRRRKVAVGYFDGVHVGHRAVIEGADTVLTFDPHPLAVLRPEAAPKMIMSPEMKRDVLGGLGVEEMVVIPFDREFSKLSAEDFIDEVLVQRLGAERVSVGENFRFGTGARGDAEMLADRGEFETRIAPLVEVDGETVSSTRIRALIASGDVTAAARCLDGPFLQQGEVVPGDQRGRELGFPTANVVPADDLVCPGHGVYAAFANEYPAAVNVGVRPTFESGRGVLVEAYLIDQDLDLYGQPLRIAYVDRLRGEKRFPDADSLIEQMKLDVEDARRACAAFSRS